MVLCCDGSFKECDKVAAFTGSLSIALVIFWFIEVRRERKRNGNAYGKLSKANKQIVDAVEEAGRETFASIQDIASAHQRLSGATIKEDALLEKLVELEETRIIERDISSKKDEPIRTWKTSFSKPIQ